MKRLYSVDVESSDWDDKTYRVMADSCGHAESKALKLAHAEHRAREVEVNRRLTGRKGYVVVEITRLPPIDG